MLYILLIFLNKSQIKVSQYLGTYSFCYGNIRMLEIIRKYDEQLRDL